MCKKTQNQRGEKAAMKKLLAFILCMAILFTLPACGQTGAQHSVSGGGQSGTDTQNTAKVPATDAEFVAALKSAGFIPEDEFDETYYTLGDDTIIYNKMQENNVVGTMLEDDDLQGVPNVTRCRYFNLCEPYWEDGCLVYPYGSEIAFMVFSDQNSAEEAFAQISSEIAASDEKYTSESGDTYEKIIISGVYYSGIPYIDLFSRIENTLVYYHGGAESAARSAFESLGY